MKDRDTSTSSRSADARGDTGTGADEHRTRAGVGSAGDVGGMPSTVDAGMQDKLGNDRGDATTNRPVGREHVRPREPGGSTAERPASTGTEDPRAAAADEEGPLESLGKAISEPVTGSPRSTPDGDGGRR